MRLIFNVIAKKVSHDFYPWASFSYYQHNTLSLFCSLAFSSAVYFHRLQIIQRIVDFSSRNSFFFTYQKMKTSQWNCLLWFRCDFVNLFYNLGKLFAQIKLMRCLGTWISEKFSRVEIISISFIPFERFKLILDWVPYFVCLEFEIWFYLSMFMMRRKVEMFTHWNLKQFQTSAHFIIVSWQLL